MVNDYTDKCDTGYKFEKVEGLPLTIATDESQNVIRVYYVKDESQTKNITYTVKYFKDGTEVTEDQQTEAGGFEEAPIGDFLLACAPARKGSPHIHQPEQQTQHSQHKHGEGAAHPACRRDEKGAEQCAAGIAAVHQVHAPGAVSGVVADEDGAGVDDTALGNAHEEEAQRQHSHRAAEAHHGVAQRIADGQQQDAGLHAQLAGQHGDEKACQQVADAHERQQGSGHAVGEAILLLQ